MRLKVPIAKINKSSEAFVYSTSQSAFISLNNPEIVGESSV